MERLTKQAADKVVKVATSPKAKKIAKATLKDLIKSVVTQKLFLRKWKGRLIEAFDGDEVAISQFLEDNMSFSKEDARRYALLIAIEDDL